MNHMNQKKNNNHHDKDIVSQLPKVVKKGTNFFSPNILHIRKTIFREYLKVNVMFMCFIVALFFLFWVATYKTESYYYKVNFLAVVQDDVITPDMKNISLPMTQIFQELFDQAQGTWHVYNQSEFVKKHILNNDLTSISDKVIDLIYSQTNWFGIKIKPNAIANLYNTLTKILIFSTPQNNLK